MALLLSSVSAAALSLPSFPLGVGALEPLGVVFLGGELCLLLLSPAALPLPADPGLLLSTRSAASPAAPVTCPSAVPVSDMPAAVLSVPLLLLQSAELQLTSAAPTGLVAAMLLHASAASPPSNVCKCASQRPQAASCCLVLCMMRRLFSSTGRRCCSSSTAARRRLSCRQQHNYVSGWQAIDRRRFEMVLSAVLVLHAGSKHTSSTS